MHEWTLKSLDQVVELRRGFDLPHGERRPGPYPVLSAGVAAGSHDEGPVGGPGFVVGRATNLGVPTWSDTDYWPLNTTLYAADFKGNDPKYLYHLFETLDLAGYDSGSVQPMLNRNYIAKIQVWIAPATAQQAIVEVLGALDDKIAVDEQVAQTAIELGNSIFDRMYSASTVTRTQLGEFVDTGALVLGDGYRTKRSEHGQPGLRILRAGDVRDGLIDPVGDDFVSQSYARQFGPKISQSGDIVMTTKGTVGRVAVVSSETERMVYSPQLCYFRVVDNGTLDRGYLAAWFRSADLKHQASLRMFKSDMAPYINLQDIRSLEVPIVPFEQQRKQGETQLKLLELFDGAKAENKRLLRLRDALLPQLMSGKIRVKDVEQMVGDVV